MRKRVYAAGVVLVVAGVALSGCGGDDGGGSSSSKSSSSSADPVWPPSGEKLSHYEGMASYEWRKSLLANQDDVDAQLSGLGLEPPEDSYDDLLNTCDSIGRGIKGDQLVQDTVTRFSVSEKDAPAVIAIAKKDVCPS